MHYFDDDDTRPLLDDDESESENMTSYVIVVNNCKRGHDAIDITLKKHTTQTSLSQKLDEQLGYLSNYILNWKSLLCKMIWNHWNLKKLMVNCFSKLVQFRAVPRNLSTI